MSDRRIQMEKAVLSDMETTVYESIPPSDKAPIELTIVIPTYNERQNVPLLIDKLELSLQGIEWEVIYVDDNSPDGTSDVVRSIARTNPRVRSIERIGRRGLASACIEGMMASPAPYIAVMDADLQHDEAVLPEMLRKIESEKLDVVIASRRIAGGSMGEFAKDRVKLSDMGTRVSRIVCRCEVSDSMSGFFIVEAKFFRSVVPRLTGSGFKILVDVLASSPTIPRAGEVPYRFRNRELGESKLDVNVQLEYVFLIIDKLIGKWVPTRFVLYMLVGALGVLVHLAVLAPLYLNHRHHFWQAQVIATVAAMTFNFLLNNVVTFRDRKLRGRRLITGLITFYLACSLGAAINVTFASMLMTHGMPWYLAGTLGTGISSVWNYGVNTVLTWRRSKR
ncbi:MAG TPA: glycosyltransferase family 2 protein [Acidisarcina sp.]